VAGFQRLLGVREEKAARRLGAEGHHYRCFWPVHAYFKLASILGSELFYIVFLPVVIWQACVDGWIDGERASAGLMDRMD